MLKAKTEAIVSRPKPKFWPNISGIDYDWPVLINTVLIQLCLQKSTTAVALFLIHGDSYN